MRRSALALILALVGCGMPPPGFDPIDPGAFTTTDAPVDSERPELQLRFNADYTSTLSAELVEGTNLRIAYDDARLPSCRGEYLGKPAWSITGYWQLDGGEEGEGTFEAGGHSPSSGTVAPVIPLDEAGELEIWFQIGSRWGCTAWDSNFGQNWRFTVKPAGGEQQ